jgi:hypothetical protein
MKWLSVGLFLHIVNFSLTQTIAEFAYLDEKYSGKKFLGINPSFNRISNKSAPYPENHRLNAVILDFQLKSIQTKQFGRRVSWYNKGLGDILYLLGRNFNGKGSFYAKEETTFSNIFGWFEHSFNLTNPNGILQVSAGINIGDYLYVGRYRIDSISAEKNIEPQGYYISGGPTADCRVLITPNFLLETSFSYAFSYMKLFGMNDGSNTTDHTYPYPNFAHFRTELISKWGAFLSFDYNWLINRGANPASGKRFGLTLGFKFDISRKE